MRYPEKKRRDDKDYEAFIRDLQRKMFGERYVGASLSSLHADRATQEKLAKFMDKPKNFLVYCGSPGIGKTYFCAALTEWAYCDFRSFRYWNESELLKRVRASMEEYRGDYLDTLKHLTDDHLIMIDDIGSTGLNEWRKEIIFDAIDERYNSMLPTIITTNFTSKEIKDNFHPRVYSRLFAKENVIIEVNNGIDQRLN